MISHLPAAVIREDDPRAHLVPRVVPRTACELKLGGAVLGYRKPVPNRRGDLRSLRLAELKRIILARHGRGGADTDDASLYLAFAAYHLPDAPSVRDFARRFTPGAPADEVEAIIDTALAKPRRFTADAAAKALAVKRDERERLRLCTIGAIDHNAEARAAERKLKDRDRKRAKRAAMPRCQTITSGEPWKAAGISRATWYRRQKDVGMSVRQNPSAVNIKIGTADGSCVTRQKPRHPVRTRTYPRIVIPHNPAALMTGEGVRALGARLARITAPLVTIAPDLRRLCHAATFTQNGAINRDQHSRPSHRFNQNTACCNPGTS